MIPRDMFKGTQKLVSQNEIRSLGDYFAHIEFARNKIFAGKTTWYRGHAAKNYSLQPGIFRFGTYSIDNELKIRDEFFDKAKWFVYDKSLKNHEWYFLMQHYGLPTRLLDWTEGYLIALFFALKITEKDNIHQNPCV